MKLQIDVDLNFKRILALTLLYIGIGVKYLTKVISYLFIAFISLVIILPLPITLIMGVTEEVVLGDWGTALGLAWHISTACWIFFSVLSLPNIYDGFLKLREWTIENAKPNLEYCGECGEEDDDHRFYCSTVFP